MKTLIIILSLITSSCSLYELRPGEYEIPVSESDFADQDAFDVFIRGDNNHE